LQEKWKCQERRALSGQKKGKTVRFIKGLKSRRQGEKEKQNLVADAQNTRAKKKKIQCRRMGPKGRGCFAKDWKGCKQRASAGGRSLGSIKGGVASETGSKKNMLSEKKKKELAG